MDNLNKHNSGESDSSDDANVVAIFKEVAGISQKLESTQGRITSSVDFFLPMLIDLRSQLCQSCFKLWFAEDFKLEYFRRAEEVLWRRVYHDIYKSYKSNKGILSDREVMLIEAHFFSGIGLYSSLIVRLRLYYKIKDSKKLLLPLGLSLESLDDAIIFDREADLETKQQPSEPRLDWAKQAVYRCLVYMGDLYRYLIETNKPECRPIAIKMYKSTSLYDPQHGMPFNQLATMSGNDNYALDAICNYMRCCSRAKPFEGAAGNMKKIFDINARFFDEINRKAPDKILEEAANKNRKESVRGSTNLMRRLIVTFIKLVADLWQGIGKSSEDPSFNLQQTTIASEIRLFFVLLKEAMDLPKPQFTPSGEPFREILTTIAGGRGVTEKPVFLSTTIMFEFANISLILLSRCQGHSMKSSNQTASMIYESALALTLNLLHYITIRCHQTISSKVNQLQAVQTPSKINGQHLLDHLKTRLVGSKENILKGSIKQASYENQSSGSTPNLSPRRALSRLRQREAAVNYADGPNMENYNFDQDDSDMSELEETALSTIDALEISSDMSEAEHLVVNKVQNLIDLDSSDEDQTILVPDCNHNPESGSYSLQDPSIVVAHLSKDPSRPVYPSITTKTNSIISTQVVDLLTGDFLPNTNNDTDKNQTYRSLGPQINSSLSISSLSPIDSISTLCAQDCEDGQDYARTSGIHNGSTQSTNFTSIMEFIYNETYLPSIKIFCDWLLSNSSLISVNCESFRAFFDELDILVTALKRLQNIANSLGGPKGVNAGMDESRMAISSPVLQNKYDGPSWIQKYPLSVDFPLMTLKTLEAVHKLNIDYDTTLELSQSDMGFICTQCVHAFADVVTVCFARKNQAISS